MGLGIGEVMTNMVLLFGAAAPILFWAPGPFEIFLILLFLACLIAVVFGASFLTKYLAGVGGKPCPHCGEKIKEVAKVCRYCHRDVAAG